jgi:multiple sugar transport system permease protein
MAALPVTLSSAFVAFGFAYFRFLLRQFFLGLPRELFEAARVDGADRPAPDHAGPDRDLRLRVQGELDRPHAAADLPARRLAVHPAPGLKVILDQFGQGGEGQREVVLAASVIATVPVLVIFFLRSQG